ncbi:sensor histidine kinase [Mediterraneibacter gnavus]|uniref:sensor histidine kinase n=1 Tax=Mediterraneibacter gnavus TaxID=33038 RepID=UPI001FA90A6A|nr:histidine kinase [Mediterraneibacter gnavus]
MKLRDDSTEKNLLLEEKNRMLAEKQDYEIYAATLKERNRIAREIHDNVGHLLSRSILITGAAKAINASDALSPVLDDLDHSLNQAMTSIRTSVHDLHDESLNLKEAAESLTSDFTFCPVTLNYDMGFEVPREIKYCFISIVKEALSNVARHSNATLVQITMREHPALYQLCIEDNGTLTESNLETLLPNRGIGLSNMNDRLKVLNGNLQITIQKGVRLFITIPKEQEY